MRFVADLHLHSRYSRATSRDLCPETLTRWASLKGLTVVGTGDFTHPEWLAELKEKLEPAEPGLFRLKDPYRSEVTAELPERCRNDVRFVLSSEISLIYKKGDRTRKVHHLIVMPDMASVDRLNARLSEIGNLKSDGRPILGMDSRDLVALCVEACEQVLFIPAHIWTPHFAVLGSRSGFDSLEACFEDMLPHIFAVETGLSSDPPMNWRLSMLKDYAIVSNSDAHSAPKLAREATCFDSDLSFGGIYEALKSNHPNRLLGTIEFYPQEGKYHWDGHRKCDVCWKPEQTRANEGLCPTCGKALTVGVLHRVESLADLPENERPESARPFDSLIPLTEVVGSVVGVGSGSKRVGQVYARLLEALGPELHILREAALETIAETGGPALAEGVRRMRAGEVHVHPGYDGEYGRIEVFDKEEREQWAGQGALFAVAKQERSKNGKGTNGRHTNGSAVNGSRADTASAVDDSVSIPVDTPVRGETTQAKSSLDSSQKDAAEAVLGPVVVIAGPGTGKTRVLTHRVAHLVKTIKVPQGSISAVTFTNRAAGEMRERISLLLDEPFGGFVGTFHRMALEFHHGPDIAVRDLVDEVEAHLALVDAIREAQVTLSPAHARRVIGLAKANGLGPDDVSQNDARTAFAAYERRMRVLGIRDFDDVLIDFCQFLLGDGEGVEAARARCGHLLVDEFQDLNAVQYEIVRLLAGEGHGLFVIGDPDQSVYGFRGSSPAFFGLLAKEIENAHRVRLNTTYRSTPEIVSSASALVSRSRPEAVRGSGPKLRFLRTTGETAEGIAVAREILRVIGGGDMLQAHGRDATDAAARSFADVAVLFRMGRQMDAVEECLLKEGIPYRIVGQKSFLDAPAVRHVLNFVRFAQSPYGGRRFLRVLGLPGYAMPEEIPDALWAHPPTLPEPDLLPKPLRPAARRLMADAASCRQRMDAVTADVLISERAAAFGLSEDASVERLVRAGEAMGDTGALLDALLLGQDADVVIAGEGLRSRPEAVTLMTLHAAKGLEYPVVLICGVEEGLLPFNWLDGEMPEGDDLDEERRLLYVGLTRAQDEVVLLAVKRRIRQGKVLRPEPSRFLDEIPEELLIREEVGASQKSQQLSLF